MGEVNFSSMMASHMQYGPIGVSDWVLETAKANKIGVKFQITSNQDWELQWSDRSYQNLCITMCSIVMGAGLNGVCSV